MAAGKRFKFQGSEIKILTGFVEDSPPSGISAITQANPAVVTSNNHGYSNGEVIRITGVVGMTDLNDGVYIIENVTTNTFELSGVDSTGYAAYISGGDVEEATFSQFCELTNYNRTGGTAPDIPATALCSTAAEYEIGLQDFGTTQLSFNFAPRTTVQGILHDFAGSGDVMAVKIKLPKNGGEMVQLGFVQQETETAGVGGIWVATATIRNTGQRVDIPAA